MRRMIRSYRTRKDVRHQTELEAQFVRQLSEQAQAILLQLTQQFAQDLQTQSARMLESFTQQGPGGMGTASGTGGVLGSFSGLPQLLTTGVRYLAARPRRSNQEQETSRSQDAESGFRLSRAQRLAEAGVALSRGEKNL